MKKFLIPLLLSCALVHGFAVEPGFVRPAGVVTYACEPELMEDFLAAFATWNDAVGNRFILKPSAIPNIDIATVVLPDGELGRTRYAMPSMRCLVEISPGVDPTLTPLTSYRRAVILHELGHALGLAHSDRATSIMFFALRSGRTATLSFDDIVGIKSIYPPQIDVTLFGTPRKHYSHWVDFALSGNIDNNSVLFDFGDGTDKVMPVGNARHYYAAAGTYTVTATVDGVEFPVTVNVGRPKKPKKRSLPWTKRIELTTKQP